MKFQFRLYAMTIVLLSLLQFSTGAGQEQSATAVADTTKSDSLSAAPGKKTQAKSTTAQAVDVGEIVLEEIKIEAVIETPSVAIVPKRLNPDFGKMEFIDRSFEKELKAIPKKPMLLGDELNGVNKIKNGKVKNIKPKQGKK